MRLSSSCHISYNCSQGLKTTIKIRRRRKKERKRRRRGGTGRKRQRKSSLRSTGGNTHAAGGTGKLESCRTGSIALRRASWASAERNSASNSKACSLKNRPWLLLLLLRGLLPYISPKSLAGRVLHDSQEAKPLPQDAPCFPQFHSEHSSSGPESRAPSVISGYGLQFFPTGVYSHSTPGYFIHSFTHQRPGGFYAEAKHLYIEI